MYSLSLPTSVKLAFLQELAHGSYKVLDSSAGKTKWDVETGVFEHSSRWSGAAPCPGEKLSLVLLPGTVFTSLRLDSLTSLQSSEKGFAWIISQVSYYLLVCYYTFIQVSRMSDGWEGSGQANPLWRDPS